MVRNADPRSSVKSILLHMILHFSLSCPTSRTHPSAYQHFPPVTPLACQVHLLFLPGTLPSPHAHLPQLCASQHFLTSCRLFLVLALQKNQLMQHNRSWLFIVCSMPPFHIDPIDGGTHALDV